MIHSAYQLQFELHPWTCRVLREGTVVLELQTDWEPQEGPTNSGEYVFSSQNRTLRVQAQSTRIRFQWQGDAVKVRLPLQGDWYGGGALINQSLRWNGIMLPLTDFVTDDNGRTGFSTNLTPAWLNSLGLGLWVRSPFKLGWNQPPAAYLKRQKGISKDLIPFEQRPFHGPENHGDGRITLIGDDLVLDVLVEDDILGVYHALVAEFGKPQRTPPLELLGAPIWTTWARYKDRIDQATVLEFACQIKQHGYPYHVLEIDDRWQTHYGDLEFDPERFPAPREMITALQEMGFKVTAWVIPFLHPHSRAGKQAAESGFVARTPGGDPYRVKWWQGAGYLLDVTNPAALEWYRDRLASFQAEVGLDGYKFDAGEAKFVPADAVFHQPLASPNQYTHRYVKWVGENFSFCEVRSGWMNQTSPIFFRLWDLWSTWSTGNGLRSMIPSTLSLALTGYPFVFPDMIGGNAYFHYPANKLISWFLHRIVVPILERRLKKKSRHPEEEALGLSDVPAFLEKSIHFGYPTPELMIRWTQANLFLQVMQFSLAPWDFGDECHQICRHYALLHLEFAPLLEKFARQAVEKGEPIIRPVFWLAPKDKRALACDDQFLVGDEILVAPVVYPGQRSREIYFPPGTWKDYWSGDVFRGPAVVRDFPAPLDILPFFFRQAES